ncbi:uncharacterized protein Dana_GF26319, isoform B [Drosophila ananassae]|uniref:Uncharacterized protein, isoform B n=1 Tax=Drosophila ananassae TaxID=7217 RepID=A0A0P8XDV1_DROAN|nr:uncharacterized protein LOC26513728 isoform X2 [Drosophila ananassae]KPU72982.1 uncharacterized protein Dana_GF26319, isoform B [Drosophila ananassae]
MKLANKNLYKLFKSAGLDLATLTLRRQIEIISVYLTWIHLVMEICSLALYCSGSVTKSFQTIHLLVDGPSE